MILLDWNLSEVQAKLRQPVFQALVIGLLDLRLVASELPSNLVVRPLDDFEFSVPLHQLTDILLLLVDVCQQFELDFRGLVRRWDCVDLVQEEVSRMVWLVLCSILAEVPIALDVLFLAQLKLVDCVDDLGQIAEDHHLAVPQASHVATVVSSELSDPGLMHATVPKVCLHEAVTTVDVGLVCLRVDD